MADERTVGEPNMDVARVFAEYLSPAPSLPASLAEVGDSTALWADKLGPLYDVFERYVPATSPTAEIARQWRAQWEQRVRDCEAGRDTWPNFLTKPEGAQFR